MAESIKLEDEIRLLYDDPEGVGGEELEAMAEALGAFALASSPVREPRAGLRDEVLSAIAAEEDPAPAAGDAAAPSEKVIPFPRLPWSLAAGFAVVAGIALLLWNAERGRVGELKGEVALLTERSLKLDYRVKELANQADDSLRAFIVWDDVRQTGVLKVENLPELGSDQDYQLWVVSEGYEHPLDGGVFDTVDGKAEMPIDTKYISAERARANQVTLFAISRERAGGVPISETKDFVLTAAY